MSTVQRFFTAIFPRSWAESMQADSRQWMVRCKCGFAQSVWDWGGIRWKAIGKQWWYLKCPDCGSRSWHKVSKEVPA